MLRWLSFLYFSEGGVMKFQDELSQHYSEILDGVYECVDRIVINGYYKLGHSPGGFRTWWRTFYGTDDNLDKTHLIRFPSRVGRRVKAFSDSKNIPLIRCKAGERKHELAEQYIPEDKNFTGIFLILVSKFPVVVWAVEDATKHLEKKYSYVNNYSFHIMDKEWGHITVRMSGHPPFQVQVMLNGHEWVERKAIEEKMQITKEGNCFTSFEDPEGLCNIAETLWQAKAGQLQRVCDRWVYPCLWFGLRPEEQQRTGFNYEYSLYQVELSRNFLFHRGNQLEEIYQNIIDLTRRRMDMENLKTIFGFKRRPRRIRKDKKTSFQLRIKRIEGPSYNMTVFKIDDGRITVKIYDKGERVLRVEVVCHNTAELKCKRGVNNFPTIVEKLRERLNAFISVLYFSHVSFIDKGESDQLSQPSKKGKQRLAGVDINKPRCRNVMKTALELSIKPGGFTAKEVAEKYVRISRKSERIERSYNSRQAAYDLRKLRAKGLVHLKKKSRKYRLTAKGVSMIVATIVIKERIFEPIVAGITKKNIAQSPQNLSLIDQLYIAAREKILDICKEYGVVGVIM